MGRLWFWGIGILLAGSLGGLFWWTGRSHPTTAAPVAHVQKVSHAASVRSTRPISQTVAPVPDGPEFTVPAVSVTAVTLNGPEIEVRFGVADLEPEMMRTILSPATQRSLIVEKTGAVLSPPAHPAYGAIRRAIGGVFVPQSYTVVFDNSRGMVKHGDKVSLLMGDLQVGNLSVN